MTDGCSCTFYMVRNMLYFGSNSLAWSLARCARRHRCYRDGSMFVFMYPPHPHRSPRSRPYQTTLRVCTSKRPSSCLCDQLLLILRQHAAPTRCRLASRIYERQQQHTLLQQSHAPCTHKFAHLQCLQGRMSAAGAPLPPQTGQRTVLSKDIRLLSSPDDDVYSR